MKRYESIIVDDEPIAHSIIENYIRRYGNIDVVGNFYNAFDAQHFISERKVDILYLDIKMPEMTGIEFLKNITKKPVTILTTAYRNYALEGFDLGVMDFLLKPIKYDRFCVATDRVVEFLELSGSKPEIKLHGIADGNENQKLCIKSGTKTLLVSPNEITHVQGLKDYSIIHTISNQKIIVKGYLKLIGEFLMGKEFVRVHKSFLVAKHCITNLNKNKISIGSHKIPVGRVYKKDIVAMLRPDLPI